MQNSNVDETDEYIPNNVRVNLSRFQNSQQDGDNVISPVGTVRGKTNKVKNCIQLFLADKSQDVSNKSGAKSTVKDSHEYNISKVVIYTTSLGLVRKTKSDCLFVRKAFRNLMIKTEERDIVIEKYRKEFQLKFPGKTVPQVLINHKIIGGAFEVEELLETGQIEELIQDIEKVNYLSEPCQNCGGHGFINCPKCLGSSRSKITRIGSSRELNYLKCTGCIDGMMQCEDCKDIIN